MRRIKKAKISFISLVPAGANQLPVIYKDNGQFDLQMIVKPLEKFEEQGIIVGTVYAPELRDGQGDIASAEVIKEAMYAAAKEGISLDIRHDAKPVKKEDAYIAESFIIQKNDPRFSDMKSANGKPVDVTGGWGIVIKIDNPTLRELYRKGEWNGISMGGVAVYENTAKEEDTTILSELVKSLKRLFKNSGDINMDKKELQEVLEANNKSLLEGLTKALIAGHTPPATPTAPPAPPAKTEPANKEDAAPVFSGELTKENLEKFEKEMARYNIRKSIDWSKPETVKKAKEELAKLESGAAAGTAGGPAGASNQPGLGSEGTTNKEGEEDPNKVGKAMASMVNASRGYPDKK